MYCIKYDKNQYSVLLDYLMPEMWLVELWKSHLIWKRHFYLFCFGFCLFVCFYIKIKHVELQNPRRVVRVIAIPKQVRILMHRYLNWIEMNFRTFRKCYLLKPKWTYKCTFLYVHIKVNTIKEQFEIKQNWYNYKK